ncbi:DNA-binding domain-containing protein [Lysobacter niastensis]|uniref:DNA-binding domain-containing protein n=1 Tax=Lysobacter niastensis TaxID=380629 RepID=A0ABS0BBK6_9GAMM|nr:putative DNA-binding domain-containing protein [Lysobacter niastensis]MBF6025069.1 putative DNA-binding domain-containing protein [Lysobacter niastensis]
MADTLREQQYVLARHLRDPGRHPPPPGIDERRLKIYRELFFHSLESLLSGTFPVIRQTLPKAQWLALVRSFYADYRSQTPLFTRIAEEFVGFLQQHAGDDTPPWVPELAHYEWVELHLDLMDAHDPAHDADGDLLDGIPVLSSLALPLGYRWQVTTIGPGTIPAVMSEQPTLLLVHRDAEARVRFSQITPLAYRLLESISSEPRTGREHLAALAQEAGGDADTIHAHGLALLEELRTQRVVLGTLNETAAGTL